MAPHEVNELKALVEMVNAPLLQALNHALHAQEDMRRLIDQTSSMQAKLEERMVSLEKDVGDLYKKLDEIEEKIIEHQQKKFTQTIAIQGTVLLLILGAFISYIVPIILQSLHR